MNTSYTQECPHCGNIVEGKIQRSTTSRAARNILKKGGMKTALTIAGSVVPGFGNVAGFVAGTAIDAIWGDKINNAVDETADIFIVDSEYLFCCPKCGQQWTRTVHPMPKTQAVYNNLAASTNPNLLPNLYEVLYSYLNEQNFQPEATEFGIHFKVQGLDFVHFKDDNDPLFLNIFFPQILPVTAENKIDVLIALDAANTEVKLANGAVRFGNAVWVGVETLLNEGYDLGAIVPRCLDTLVHCRQQFYQAYRLTPSGQAETL